MHGLAGADEHQTGDRTETMQWSVDAQRRTPCKSRFTFFGSSPCLRPARAFSYFSLSLSARGDRNRPGEEVLVPLCVRLPDSSAADVREQSSNEAHLWPRHLQRCTQQTYQCWEVS